MDLSSDVLGANMVWTNTLLDRSIPIFAPKHITRQVHTIFAPNTSLNKSIPYLPLSSDVLGGKYGYGPTHY